MQNVYVLECVCLRVLHSYNQLHSNGHYGSTDRHQTARWKTVPMAAIFVLYVMQKDNFKVSKAQ